MSHFNTWNEPFLPWVESENDRRFKRLLWKTIIIFMVLGIIIGYLPRPELEQKELKDVSPRLAKLIIQKKKAPPPPPPKVTKKKKVDKKKKKTEKKKPKTKKQKSAKKKAEKSGILAMSDQLADLRESFDVSQLSNSRQLQKSGKTQSKMNTNTSAVITAKSNRSSGGINTKSLSRSTGGSSLSGIKSSNVQSSIASGDGAGTSGSGGRSQGRSESEVQLVFQKNAAAIDSLYNRALRKDPGLQGKVVFQLVIAPSGKVLSVKIISSELNNPKLESRLKSRIKLFRFPKKSVATMTINYPIDFLPS